MSCPRVSAFPSSPCLAACYYGQSAFSAAKCSLEFSDFSSGISTRASCTGKATLRYGFVVMETGCLFCLGSSNSKFPASLYKFNLASSWTIDTPQHPVCSLLSQRAFFQGHYFSPWSGFLWCLSFWWDWSCVKLFTPDFFNISRLHNWKLRSLWRSHRANRE